ncbi:hypothetical protein Pen01_05160 [Phytomonospora endophytica]|nr:hypothetical protein Pen01_05160 [Phytomonospora endophytica]
MPALAAALLAAATLTALSSTPAQADGVYLPQETDDFDCDGLRDAYHDESGPDELPGSGGFAVVYTTTGRTAHFTQNTPGITGTAEKGDRFGAVHSSYDRNKDGCDDLVVGAPGEGIGSAAEAGMVWIIPGSPTGLDTSKSFAYSQNTAGVPGTAETRDGFGTSLAAGTTSAGAPFLIIGSPDETVGRYGGGGGMIHYLRDGKWTTITQDTKGVIGNSDDVDHFGEVLVANERFFAVGMPYYDDGASWTGAVQVMTHGSATSRPWAMASVTQGTAGVEGTPEEFDFFGSSVSLVSYRSSTSAPVGVLLAIGVPDEDLISNTAEDAGSAHLVSVVGSKVTALSYLDQSAEGVPDSAQDGDNLGAGVVVATSDGSAIATPSTTVWAASVPGETTADGFYGAAHVMRGVKNPGASDIWMQATRHGLPADGGFGFGELAASARYLYLGSGPYFGVPWNNILRGANEPVLENRSW